MNNKKTYIPLLITSIILAITGFSFLIISLLDIVPDSNWPLSVGLGCSAIGTFMNTFLITKKNQSKN